MGGVSDVIAWLRSRVLTRRIVLLLCLLIASWCLLDSQKNDVYTFNQGIDNVFTASFMLAWLLVTFRLWDDFADRPFDSTHNTGSKKPRVLVVTTHTRLFLALLCASMLVLVITVYQTVGDHGISLFLVLCICLVVVYSLPMFKNTCRLLRELLILLKYPIFLLILSNGLAIASILMAVAVYFILLVSLALERRITQTSRTEVGHR